jgi:hypothetical protein
MRFAVKFCLFSGGQRCGARSAHKFMPTSGRSNVSALLVYNPLSKATQSILRFPRQSPTDPVVIETA